MEAGPFEAAAETAEHFLKPMSFMTWSYAAIAMTLVLGGAACSRDRAASTATIPPAEPRPGPPVASTVGSQPMITTSGSPTPASAIASGNELVTITGNGFGVRPFLPRVHTALRIDNQTSVAHEVELRSPTSTSRAKVLAKSGVVLQLLLRDSAYELVCTTPGHGERARFGTYAPGVPPNAASPTTTR